MSIKKLWGKKHLLKSGKEGKVGGRLKQQRGREILKEIIWRVRKSWDVLQRRKQVSSGNHAKGKTNL